jgi:hypothetical protein
MQFLKELINSDKYSQRVEGVDDVIPSGREDYVDLPKPGVKKKKKTVFPTTDSAENSIINTLWQYQNADAS